ncbi:predicted protein [Lichtheimia corymbifera JMRC:FSU:9682]|uniref:Endonuclease/exonuclease/phosphatase domain-containing protein n=1 Tax=Lichtheimia corymbifera JMRC:FSU:9682 TaxID=1263082 RepID=A0A068RXX2_9FUNG|nr:predicted protein [Lichtheimia corymbifera JMRC:FSU:9682]CDH61171.1 predicted protein [Lichtheimia corymbifera JMRC:FSU:9682]
MTISDSLPWSHVVAKGARMRVITPARRSQNSEISTDIFCMKIPILQNNKWHCRRHSSIIICWFPQLSFNSPIISCLSHIHSPTHESYPIWLSGVGESGYSRINHLDIKEWTLSLNKGYLSVSLDLLLSRSHFYSTQSQARKAAAIVRQALTPDSVLFTVPTSAFAHRSDVYKAIETQIGPLEDVRHQHMLCRVINTYAPAQCSARQDFLSSFMALPFIEEVETGPWLMVGDFNMNLHHQHIIRQNHATSWLDWLNTHFDNCFPKGAPTFKRGDSRSTIDYIYGHHSIMTRLTNASSHFLPSDWTDHSILTIDIILHTTTERYWPRYLEVQPILAIR